MASVETETETKAGRPSEEERVVRWRAEELARAGYDEASALEIGLATDVDLHRAAALVRGGCPVDTARRILL